jgi:hypothetical protein
MMKRYLIPFVVAVTSLTLVVALVATGTLAVPNVLAGSPWYGHAGWDGPWSRASGWQLPAELQGLQDVPAEQRFSHFLGARLSLRDKKNQPHTVEVTPGKVTAASATSLTVAANDGTTKTFTLNEQTAVYGKGKPSASGASGAQATPQGTAQATPQGTTQAAQPVLATGDEVCVITVNGSSTASAVFAGGLGGPGVFHGGARWGGGWGPFAHGR